MIVLLRWLKSGLWCGSTLYLVTVLPSYFLHVIVWVPLFALLVICLWINTAVMCWQKREQRGTVRSISNRLDLWQKYYLTVFCSLWIICVFYFLLETYYWELKSICQQFVTVWLVTALCFSVEYGTDASEHFCFPDLLPHRGMTTDLSCK